MFKQKMIFVLFLVVIMVSFLSGVIWAQERTIFFEKGDALYRRGMPWGSWWLGHCGLYYKWIDLNEEGKPNNSDDFATHRVIESMGGRIGRVHGIEDVFTFEEFNCTPFWGVYTCHALTAAQRRFIIDVAKVQDGCEYAFIRYKNPSDYDEYGNYVLGSFRCDGLVEYCYEVAFGHLWEPGNNGGLILNDTWRNLSPREQMNSPLFLQREDAIVKEVRLEPSEEDTLEAYASDGDKGSGITMVEFWYGEPDDTPDNYPGKRLGWDNHDVIYGESEENHIYQVDVDWDVHGGLNVYAKAFDQAGNTKVPVPIKDTYVTKYNPDWSGEGECQLYIRKWCGDGVCTEMQRSYFTYGEGYSTLHIFLYDLCANCSPLPGWTVQVYEVDPDTFSIETVTWNNQPEAGELIDSFYVWYTGELLGWYSIDIRETRGVCIKLASWVEERDDETCWISIISSEPDTDDRDRKPYLTREQ